MRSSREWELSVQPWALGRQRSRFREALSIVPGLTVHCFKQEL